MHHLASYVAVQLQTRKVAVTAVLSVSPGFEGEGQWWTRASLKKHYSSPPSSKYLLVAPLAPPHTFISISNCLHSAYLNHIANPHSPHHRFNKWLLACYSHSLSDELSPRLTCIPSLHLIRWGGVQNWHLCHTYLLGIWRWPWPLWRI